MRHSAQGTLSARKVADLVVLDGDPTTVDADRIGAIAVVATMVGGQAGPRPGGPVRPGGRGGGEPDRWLAGEPGGQGCGTLAWPLAAGRPEGEWHTGPMTHAGE